MHMNSTTHSNGNATACFVHFIHFVLFSKSGCAFRIGPGYKTVSNEAVSYWDFADICGQFQCTRVRHWQAAAGKARQDKVRLPSCMIILLSMLPLLLYYYHRWLLLLLSLLLLCCQHALGMTRCLLSVICCCVVCRWSLAPNAASSTISLAS